MHLASAPRAERRNLFVLAIALVLAIVGCAGDGAPPDAEGAADDDDLRAALVLPGPIDDRGYNQGGYQGLLRAEEELGVEVAISESTAPPDQEPAFTDFSSRGFDVVVGLGFQFGETAEQVAPDFPDTIFFAIGDPELAGENYIGVMPLAKDASYLAGYAAAALSETGRVSGIAGLDFPAIVAQMEAFKMGVEAHGGVNVNITYMGDQDDPGVGKETAKAEIAAGSDVLYHIADAAGVGVLQGAEEEGVMAIGWPVDQSNIAPRAVVFSQKVDLGELVFLAIESVVNGTYEGGAPAFYGFEEGVVGLLETDDLPEDLQAELEELEEQIIAGEIDVPYIATPDGD